MHTESERVLSVKIFRLLADMVPAYEVNFTVFSLSKAKPYVQMSKYDPHERHGLFWCKLVEILHKKPIPQIGHILPLEISENFSLGCRDFSRGGRNVVICTYNRSFPT